MKPSEIHAILNDLPFMRLKQARKLYDLILTYQLSCCLELGFYHGVSSAYIAGAIQDLGSGRLITIDKENARNLNPSIGTLLATLKLEKYVEYYFERTSYNWRLMKLIEAGMQNAFDFCYIDGGHTWYSTGFAFFLVSKLLKPGGWIIFDDLYWTHEKSKRIAETPEVKAMPAEERTTPQVLKVYELLVKTDPAFGSFSIDGQWGYAQKLPRTVASNTVNLRHEV